MNHQINIDKAIAIAKEYHLKAEVTKCIKQCGDHSALFAIMNCIVTET